MYYFHMHTSGQEIQYAIEQGFSMIEQHLIEWDVVLWTYVLYYKDKQYVLDVDNIADAYDRFEFIKHGLQRHEENV